MQIPSFNVSFKAIIITRIIGVVLSITGLIAFYISFVTPQRETLIVIALMLLATFSILVGLYIIIAKIEE